MWLLFSKHNGFIWIKRKHYFDPSLNPFFFKKYLGWNYVASLMAVGR